MSFQQTIIIGNVGRDPELRYTQSGRPVLGFSVAVSERWTDRETNEKREKTTWYKVSVWGPRAEALKPHIRKGDQIQIVGNVTVSAYTDKDGNPAASLELNAREIVLLRNNSNGQGASDDGNIPDTNQNMNDIPF